MSDNYCVYCGMKVYINVETGKMTCNNENCLNPQKEWNFEENKDNQEWTVRHIRILETDLIQLTSEFQAEYNKISEFMGCLTEKMNEFQTKMGELENVVAELQSQIKSLKN